MRAYVSLSPSETEFKHGIKEIVAGFENTIGRYNIFGNNMRCLVLICPQSAYHIYSNKCPVSNKSTLGNKHAFPLFMGKGLPDVIQNGFGTLKFL